MVSATALAQARETARMAFAPSLDLLGVPSRSMRMLSSSIWFDASISMMAPEMISFTFATAFWTPLPRYRFLSPSRSSVASCSPVDAPEGTAALPTKPDESSTSTSTVGFPRESRISLALTSVIIFIMNS